MQAVFLSLTIPVSPLQAQIPPVGQDLAGRVHRFQKPDGLPSL
jgi:hypothetical protein